MRVNQATINLIKEFEGWRAEAYLDPVGICTIGYGTTAAAGVGIVPVLGMVITKEEGEWYLQQAVEKFSDQIEDYFTVDPNENEFGAFVSLAYNIGPGAFKKSSALRHFNNGDKARSAKSILLWNKAGGKILGGLVRRREAEKFLFEYPLPVAPIEQKKPAKLKSTRIPVTTKGGAISALIVAAIAAIALKFREIIEAIGGLF